MTDEPFALSQESDTQITAQQHSAFGYRYAYSRSADSLAHQDKGQDYLAFRENGQRLVFALCDGVSQSFYGDLAARLLGESLLYNLWRPLPPNTETFQKELEEFLDSLIEPASKEVESFPIPSNLAPMLLQVLEQKRTVGSESTFVTGLLDFQTNQIFLAWMGDSRLRLWGPDGEITDQLGDTFHTQERWSTRRGRIGDLHTISMSLSKFRYLIAYSDGLARLDKIMVRHFRDASIDAVIEDALLRPESDDTSFFEVWKGGQRPIEYPPLLAPPVVDFATKEGQTSIHWRPVAEASYYEVRLDDGQSFIVFAQGQSLVFPTEALNANVRTARIRSWKDEPGIWSAELPLPLLETAPILTPRTELIMPTSEPLPPKPIHYPPPLLPPSSPSFWNNNILKIGLPILLFGCLLIIFGLISFPASPLHTAFFPSTSTATLSPTSIPQPIFPSTATVTSTLTPEISNGEVPTQPQETSALIIPTETISIPTNTFTPEQSVPTQKFCLIRDISEIDIIVSPLQQLGTKDRALKSQECLDFDGWSEDKAYGSYWLRIASAQLGFEDIAGKWILANRLNAPEDTSMLSITKITLIPDSSTSSPVTTP